VHCGNAEQWRIIFPGVSGVKLHRAPGVVSHVVLRESGKVGIKRVIGGMWATREAGNAR
jgi:hypothetical protein